MLSFKDDLIHDSNLQHIIDAYEKNILAKGELFLVELNGNNPPTIKTGTRFFVESTQTTKIIDADYPTLRAELPEGSAYTIPNIDTVWESADQTLPGRRSEQLNPTEHGIFTVPPGKMTLMQISVKDYIQFQKQRLPGRKLKAGIITQLMEGVSGRLHRQVGLLDHFRCIRLFYRLIWELPAKGYHRWETGNLFGLLLR